MKTITIFFFIILLFVGIFFLLEKKFVFVKKDCLSLYNQQLKQVKLLEKKLSLLNQVESCSTEKESWLILNFLLQRVLEKKDILEIKKVERKIAEISFYKWKNYQRAIKFYNRLLDKAFEPGERFLYQYQIADSFFHLEKFSQALIEIKKTFFEGISKEQKKRALSLKFQILLFQKDFLSVEKLLRKKLKEFPEDHDFLRESLAFVYETQKKFLLAIEELKRIEKKSVFLEEKIKRLENRQSEQVVFK